MSDQLASLHRAGSTGEFAWVDRRELPVRRQPWPLVRAIVDTAMLTVAALGMFSYGVYSTAWAAVDLVRGARLEIWAELGLIGFGLLLTLSAAFVRVRGLSR